MPFSEKIKLEVKRKSAFCCCRCHEIGVDVHHIIPESEDGSDDIENAAPLCQNCHDRFGSNPEKRKEIRQMRDWWYEVVQEKYWGEQENFREINDLILQVQNTSTSHITEFERLKAMLETKLADLHDEIKKLIANQSKTGIQYRVSEFVSVTRLADHVYTNFQCKKCGTAISLFIGANRCPNCKEPF